MQPSELQTSGAAAARGTGRLRHVNRILYVRELPYSITGDDLYTIFGKFGPLRQVRIGTKPETKGTAFVVYDDLLDAKKAVDQLTGVSFKGRFLVLMYYNEDRQRKAMERRKKRQQEIEELKAERLREEEEEAKKKRH